MSEEAGDERGLPCEVGGASAGSAALAGGHREVKNVLVVGGGVAGQCACAQRTSPLVLPYPGLYEEAAVILCLSYLISSP